MNGKVFISYRWTEPSGSIVNNWLKPSFHQAGINCLIDKDDCGYNANIDKFEAELPLAAKVVLVLSRAFFFSIDCLFEAALAVSRCDVDKQVYVINVQDYNFRKDEEKWFEQTVGFLQEQRAGSETSRAALSDSPKGPYEYRIRKIDTILNNLDALWEMLSSKNSGEFKTISLGGFKVVCDIVKESLEEAVYKNDNLIDNNIQPSF